MVFMKRYKALFTDTPGLDVKHNREIMHIIVEHEGKKAIDFSK